MTQTKAIAEFSERVILESVDASPEQKAAFVANVRKNIEAWQRSPASGLHMKALGGGRLVGAILVRDYWNLCNLFVARGAQGRGIGSALIRCAVDACRSKSPRGYIRMNSSQNAIGFYQHLGFQEVVDAPAHYSAVQFQLDL